MLTLFEKKNLLDSILREFDEIFNENYSLNKPINYNNQFIPLNDIIETENEYKLELIVPAFDKKDFKIKIDNNRLIINGERKINENTKYNFKQSYFGKFKKEYTLPNTIDSDNINAVYENGVLKIKIPKLEEKINEKLIEIK